VCVCGLFSENQKEMSCL